MFFSEYFGISHDDVNKEGFLDISISSDIPLYIDPMLIAKNGKYAGWNNEIIKYFYFVLKLLKTCSTEQDKDYIKTNVLNFHEVKNIWLGVSKTGNSGRGMGDSFATHLVNDLPNCVETKIANSFHVERTLLFYDGEGNDKISDLIANLIKVFLAELTEKFVNNYLQNSPKVAHFTLEKSLFNYDNDCPCWVDSSRTYNLPFIEKNGSKEYILLVPYNILRKNDLAISKKNMKKHINEIDNYILNHLENPSLRLQYSTYITRKLKVLEELAKAKKRNFNKEASKQKVIKELLRKPGELSWVYDCGIKIIEDETKTDIATNKFIDDVYYSSSKCIRDAIDDTNNYLLSIPKPANSLEMARLWIKHFKEKMEAQDCYKLVNPNMTHEDEFQLMLRLTDGYCKQIYDFDINYEANNGQGKYDIKISKGHSDQCIIETKRASHPHLDKVFSQLDVYLSANNCNNGIVLIFCVDDADIEKVNDLLQKNEDFKAKKDFVEIVDCRKKESASRI